MIGALWDAIAGHAVTTEEANLIVNFLTRLILRHTHLPSAAAVSHPPTAPPDSSTCNAINLNKESSISTSASSKKLRRKAVCSEDVVRWVFQELLCDKKFISSHFFTTQAFACTNKLFLWLNAEAHLLVEAKDKQPFVIIGQPSSLIGITVFLDIVMSCHWDDVAKEVST